MNDIIFISHRGEDKEIVDCFCTFLKLMGVPNSQIFCSSLPGNDVIFDIASEVKEKLEQSAINIIILSQAYFESRYCLQESGVFWYRNDVPVIIIGLQDVSDNDIGGFFKDNKEMRRLDNIDDIGRLHSIVSDALRIPKKSPEEVIHEGQKLVRQYRNLSKVGKIVKKTDEIRDRYPVIAYRKSGNTDEYYTCYSDIFRLDTFVTFYYYKSPAERQVCVGRVSDYIGKKLVKFQVLHWDLFVGEELKDKLTSNDPNILDNMYILPMVKYQEIDSLIEMRKEGYDV